MATWHQQQGMRRNPRPLYHETLWTVVDDAPNQPMGLIRHESEDAAQTCLANIHKRNPHAYLLPPGGIRITNQEP